MSGILHAIGKVFHAVGHAVEGAVKWVAHNWEYIALAAAAVYTGGLALGWWGGAAAAAGGAAGGATELAGGGFAGGVFGSGGALAEGTATELAGGGIAGGVFGSGGALADSPATAMAVNAASGGGAAASNSMVGSWWNAAKGAVSDVGGKVASAAKWFTTGDSMAVYGKMQLLGTALNMAGAYMASKPRAQMQFSGRNPHGQGAGVGMHTTNGGFGLAPGGSTPAPSGVPGALLPPGTQPPQGQNAAPGATLSDAANANPSGNSTVGNIGQTVANQAGVGGLVPQGAVDFMGAAHA